MSFLSALFGASEKKTPTLPAALLRLLPDERTEASATAKRRRHGPELGLPALPPSAWSEAASAASDMGELIALRSDLTGVAAVFLGLSGGPGQRELLLGAAAALAELAVAGGRDGGFIATSERASPAALFLLRSRAGGGRFYSARDGAILVYIDEAVASAAETALAAAPERLAELASAEAPSIPSPSVLSIDRDLDFVLSHFFMPPLFSPAPAAAGVPPGPEAAVFWDELSAEGIFGADSLWFVGSMGDPTIGLVALFELPLGGIADRRDFAARVLPVLRSGWNRAASRLSRLALAGSAPRFGQISEAPKAHLRGAIRASGEIRLGMGGFPIAAWLPSRFLALLASSLRPALETPGGGANALSPLLVVNEALLERWAPNNREAFLRPRSFPGSARPTCAPPLAALLRVMGKRDAGLALQNCILARYSAQGLPYLFYYLAPVAKNGQRAMRPLPFVPFRDADVVRLLPEAAREEWAHERRYDLPRRAVSLDDCVAANEEATRLLWDACRAGKIELSPGSHDLLEERVGKPLAAAAEAELEMLAAKDIPFGFLATLEKRDANRIVDRISNKDLALAAAGDRRHIELLHSAMGFGRRRDFDEELEIVESRIARGEASPSVAAEMKRALLRRMQEYAEDLTRERAAFAAGPPRSAAVSSRSRVGR
jgi:hypothetical protein